MRFSHLAFAGYYEQAERDCRQNLERDPLNGRTQLWLGRILDRLGRIDEATQHYERELARAPQHLYLFTDFIQHLLDFADDADRAEQFVGKTLYYGAALPWARARVAHARGDNEPLRSLVAQWVTDRETHYVSAKVICQEYYRLGGYGEHIRWFEVCEQDRSGLNGVRMWLLHDQPDYWDRLAEWVLDDPASEARSRMALLNVHRARVDRITEKMVLPPDFIE